MDSKEEVSPSTNRYRQMYAVATSCLIPLSAGVTFGVTAVMLPQLREDKSIYFNPDHESWIASISTISLIFSSVGSGKFIDSFGRKAAHMVVAFPFLIGWIIIACSKSTSTIMVGRLITGISSGANKVITMVYIAEVTEPNIRSIALMTSSLTLLVGVFFSHFVGYYVYWKTSCIICLVPIVSCMIASIFLKESPFWLIRKGRIDEGIENFRWFRGTSDAAEDELKAALERQSETPKLSAKESFKAICTKAFIKPTLVIMVIVFNIHLSGLNVLTFYSLDIFEEAFKGNIDPFMIMMAMDSLRIIVAIGICVFGKLMPKKVEFLISNFGNSISVFGLVTCFITEYDVLWVSVLCLAFYIAFTSAIVTIGWTYVPELLPGNARGIGSGVNSAISYILLFAMVKTTPGLIKTYGVSAVFMSYGISTLVCGLILCFALPETNGKTLQSIEDSYKNKRKNNNVA